MTSMQRAVYRLHYVEHHSHAEIAGMLRISRPAVTRRLRRIDARFVAAGLEQPRRPGQAIVKVRSHSLSTIDSRNV